MERDKISILPHPIANALQSFLDEDLARSADELSELFVALIEYVGAVALADYLDGHAEPQYCANNASLNGWLVSQLATGKAEAGHWARWTQIAVLATTHPAVPCLKHHVEEGNLDDPTKDIAWMLRFRNDVMHGGFVAPLSKIKQAVSRMKRIFGRLAPLWALRPLGCCVAEPDAIWHRLQGLKTSVHDVPSMDREDWQGAGSVVLVDENHRAVLAIHPGCEVDPEGWMHLQHAWRKHHPILFDRPAIRIFFDRYQKERMGQIHDDEWKEAVQSALPSRGYVSRISFEARLIRALSPTGAVVRLVGPVGSGRSTLLHQLSALTQRPTFTLPIEPASVRMDPGVLRRWIVYTLSMYFTGSAPPPQLSKSRPNSKDKVVIAAWEETMAAGRQQKPAPILSVDDSDLIATGLYSASSTKGCLSDARRFGASVLLVHRPSGVAPSNGDLEMVVSTWSADELAAWGADAEREGPTGGHAALLADRKTGMESLRKQLDRVMSNDDLVAKGFRALLDGPASILEIADAIDAFTPDLELSFREQLDYLTEAERPPAEPGGSPTRLYVLYPAIEIALREQGEQ
ncbi:MAG: hypothetical protein VX278_00990 [Myxococcota bacterium]|nr:hypothetical protein [Myxococcota bacterium]